MRNAGGYVRLYRSMLDWEWYDNDACVRIMLHLLLTVNWEPKKWHGQTVEPGQIITSMEGLSKTLGMTRTSVRRTFDKLKSSGEVTVQTNNHWTLVTLTSWAEYQGDEPNNGRPLSRPLTDQRPTTDRPAATTKEGKNIRREEKSIAPIGAVVEMNWPNWAGPKTRETWEEFKAHKKAHHGFRYKTVASEQAAIDILSRYYSDGKTCVSGLSEAMAKGYKFPVDPAKEIHIGGKVETTPAHLKDANRKPETSWQPLK